MMKLLRELQKLFKRFSKEKEGISKHDSIEDQKSSVSIRKADDRNVDVPSSIIRKKQKKAFLQVGLDFGTSSTKIVYSQLGRRLSRPIDFNHNLPNYPNYCLPSLAAIDRRGRLLLGIDAAKFLSNKEWDSGLQRFKVIVAGKHDPRFEDPLTNHNFYKYRDKNGYDHTFSPERLTAVYLAYAMKECREIIEMYPEYMDVELDIAFNICMPIDHIENDRVKTVFEKVFAWAELIERDWRKCGKGFDPVKSSYKLENKIVEEDKRVYAVPEAVAAMASYLVSLRKEAGLHAIIDLGAGTTDVSICNLLIPFGEPISHWFAAKNIPRGTIHIERIVASFIKESKNNSLCTFEDIYNCLDNLQINGLKAANPSIVNRKMNETVLNELNALRDSREYHQTWGSAYYRHLKKYTAWEKVEIFVCGGGASLPHIEEVFSRPWWKNLYVKYPVSKLPTPDDYKNWKSTAPFERMAVAYGLARPLPELERYMLPAETGDHTPPPLPVLELDRDDLYPK